jgi:hypothetical protein
MIPFKFHLKLNKLNGCCGLGTHPHIDKKHKLIPNLLPVYSSITANITGCNQNIGKIPLIFKNTCLLTSFKRKDADGILFRE